MRPYDFSPSTIGFDRMFDLFSTEIPQDQETFHRTTSRVPGFAPEQIAVICCPGREISPATPRVFARVV
jgi:hypothetical protein